MSTPTLNIEVKITTYADQLGSGLFHYMAEGPLNTVGFGTDFKETNALIKAVSECAERHCMRSVADGGRITSSGFAAHNSRELAQQKAALELIERDAFLVGWLSGNNPYWLSEEEQREAKATMGIREALARNGFFNQFGVVAKVGKSVVVVGLLRPGPNSDIQFGYVLACSCAGDLTDAINATTIELARAGTVLRNRNSLGELYSAIEESEVHDGRTTFEYFLNPKNGESLDRYRQSSGSVLQLSSFDPVFDYFTRDINDPPLKIHIARATSSRAQQLFFGRPTKEVINSKRFSDLGLDAVNFSAMPLP